MTPEQFKIFMEVFQNHIRNMHHLDIILYAGIPAMILFIIMLIFIYKIHLDLNNITDLMRLR